jgi:hypothetical protein
MEEFLAGKSSWDLNSNDYTRKAMIFPKGGIA